LKRPAEQPESVNVELWFGTAPLQRRGRSLRGSSLGDFNFKTEPAWGAAAEIRREIFSQIPPRLGRMVVFGSLPARPPRPYAHPSLIESFGREVADRTLCHNHHLVFTDWLSLNLSDQKSELDEYLRITRTGLEGIEYRDLVPATAHEVERQLYLTDLEVLLQLLSFERGGAFRLPEASPRR